MPSSPQHRGHCQHDSTGESNLGPLPKVFPLYSYPMSVPPHPTLPILCPRREVTEHFKFTWEGVMLPCLGGNSPVNYSGIFCEGEFSSLPLL